MPGVRGEYDAVKMLFPVRELHNYHYKSVLVKHSNLSAHGHPVRF